MSQKQSLVVRQGTPCSWRGHWDPHPVCWLAATLAAPPYEVPGLGYRACPAGGIAATLPDTELLVDTRPMDERELTWMIRTRRLDRPDEASVDFGTFTWVRRIDQSMFDPSTGVVRLPDGSTLSVTARSGYAADARYAIRSRTDPDRTVAGTGSWADLPAIERIAARIYAHMLAPNRT